ncbi:MAG: DNA translocase FtsK 4TM domain-containing protein [Alphaproteobacteria bacterium]|jgi:S-DNA-T family DNA segregation ATPase FtsK/SpoIIIE
MMDSETKKPILSPVLWQFLRHRMQELLGIFLVAIGLGLALALVTSSSSDTAMGVVSSYEVVNLLGRGGALVAGFVRDILGNASYCLVLFPLFWGYRLIRKQRIGQKRVRLLVAPFALGLLATGFYGIAGGNLGIDGGGETDDGGAVGAIIHKALEPLIPELPMIWELTKTHYVGIGCMVLGLLLLAWSAALSRAQFALLTTPAKLFAKGVGKLFRILVPEGGWARNNSDDAVTEKPKKAKQAKKKASKGGQRKEPVLVAGATPLDASADRPRTRSSGKQESLDFGSSPTFTLPARKLLKAPKKAAAGPSKQALAERAAELESVLGDFSVNGSIGDARYGPVVTRYDLNPAPGTKSQRVIALADDIARSMSAVSVRVAVVPGQNVIGIELPNPDRQVVMLREILDHEIWHDDDSDLPMALGKDIAGTPVVADLARMPHLLVAGTTGSGKSVGINAMILSLLYRHTPETCRMIMIDPKMLELSVYDGIPHLLSPVVTDPSKAVTALKWAVREMESRYRNMAKMGVRNITGYNQRLAEARANGEVLTRRVQTGFDSETGKPVHEEEVLDLAPLPFIVVVIDEVADLMLVAGKEIEAAVQRLAQMARAAGIHVIMATQRPSVDVITGTIKANFPTRISFQVTSRIDSRTILGEQGAEQLLGRGDMLFMEGGGRVLRVHGPFVDDSEVEAVANFLRQQGAPEYDERVVAEETGETGDSDAVGAMGGSGNSLYEQAVQLVVREQKASTSFVQRHLKIGYNRAATIIEEMESNGIISAANHVGKRDVLITADDGDGM